MTATRVRNPVQLESADVNEERVAQLRLLFPECFVDGRFDADKMRAAVGDLSAMGPERFLFTWAGRADATQLLQTLSRATWCRNRNSP